MSMRIHPVKSRSKQEQTVNTRRGLSRISSIFNRTLNRLYKCRRALSSDRGIKDVFGQSRGRARLSVTPLLALQEASPERLRPVVLDVLGECPQPLALVPSGLAHV